MIAAVLATTPVESLSLWRDNLQVVFSIARSSLVSLALQVSEVVDLVLDCIDDIIDGLALSLEPEELESMIVWHAVKASAMKRV